MRVAVAMKFKLKRSLKQGLKQQTLSNLYNTFNFLFIYFIIIE